MIQSIYEYLSENKEWVFSGVGVIFLAWLLNVYSNKIKNQRDDKASQSQRSGAKSSNIQVQAGRDVYYNNPDEKKN